MPIVNSLRAFAVRAMVNLLTRWGYVVAFREPLVLSIDQLVDNRLLEMSKVEAETVRRAFIHRAASEIGQALADKGHIEWLTYEEPVHMATRIRGRLRFYPVLP